MLALTPPSRSATSGPSLAAEKGRSLGPRPRGRAARPRTAGRGLEGSGELASTTGRWPSRSDVDDARAGRRGSAGARSAGACRCRPTPGDALLRSQSSSRGRSAQWFGRVRPRTISAADLDRRRLEVRGQPEPSRAVGRRDAVVAEQRVGEDEDLAAERRIRQRLGVADHPGREDDLADALDRRRRSRTRRSGSRPPEIGSPTSSDGSGRAVTGVEEPNASEEGHGP